MKNIIGKRLDFDVQAHAFDEGLRIHHVGTASVNKNATVGKNVISQEYMSWRKFIWGDTFR